MWLFAYGSIMWNPGFAYAESAPALLRGWHRAFCIYSYRYRGTPEKPGLVLGLIVGRDAQINTAFDDDGIVHVHQHKARSRRSRIPAGAAVCIQLYLFDGLRLDIRRDCRF